MANTKQSIKRARQADEHRLRNQGVKTKVRTMVKNTRASIATTGSADDKEKGVTESRSLYKQMQSTLDHAARKGMLHPKKSARLKSRINQQLKTASAAE